MAAPDVAGEIEEIAELVNKITIVRIDPEKFHIARSEVVARLRKLAGQVRSSPAARRTTVWRPEDDRRR